MRDKNDDDHDVFVGDIEAFLRDHKMPYHEFGRRSGSGPAFVYQVMDGRRVRAATKARVRAWMEEFTRQADISQQEQ